MIQYLFKINKERWEALVKLRGWKHPITALAKRTGFTKSMCSQAINGGIAIGQEFMLALIKVSGANTKDYEEWAGLFEVVQEDMPDRPYQAENMAKYNGLKSYTEHSDLKGMRLRDKAKNLERLFLPKPIPAIDFYDDAIPRKCQVKYRYGK